MAGKKSKSVTKKNKEGKTEGSSRKTLDEYRRKGAETMRGYTEREEFKYVRMAVFGILLVVGLYLVLMPILPQLPYYLRELKGEN